MQSLADLPQEIKSQIMGLVIDEAKNNTSLSTYASVCPEWQHIAEAQTYNNLTLRCRPGDVTEFGINVTPNRQRYVKHILLQMEMQDRWNSQDDTIFSNAITKLVQQLSAWDTRGPDANTGLTLELGAYSSTIEREIHHRLPQDSAAYYSAYLNGTLSDADSAKGRDSFLRALKENNQKIMSLSGHVSRPLPSTRYSLVGLKSLKVRDARLSEVSAPVVTGFLVRLRQTRNFSPQTFSKILACLPLLEDVRIEHWQFGDARLDSARRKDAATFIKQLYSNAEPCAMKRLSLYEGCSALYHHQPYGRDSNFGLDFAHSILEVSRNLEQLSVSFMLQAEEFLDFETLYRTYHYWKMVRTDTEIKEWPRLREVALTSRKILADDPSGLLLAAARTSMRMPALETLEIWFGERGGHMGVFRYRCKGGGLHGGEKGPTIEFFRSFWCFIEHEVKDAWQEVADQKGWRDYQLGARRCGVKRDMGADEREYWMQNRRKEIVATVWVEKWNLNKRMENGHKRRKNGPGHVVDHLELKDLVLHELSRDLVKV